MSRFFLTMFFHVFLMVLGKNSINGCLTLPVHRLCYGSRIVGARRVEVTPTVAYTPIPDVSIAVYIPKAHAQLSSVAKSSTFFVI
jgi:hypothetical protein